jgi:hypothetical protein
MKFESKSQQLRSSLQFYNRCIRSKLLNNLKTNHNCKNLLNSKPNILKKPAPWVAIPTWSEATPYWQVKGAGIRPNKEITATNKVVIN